MAEIIEHPRMVAIYDALDPTAATLIRTPPTLTIGAPAGSGMWAEGQAVPGPARGPRS
ncbi:MAG TPA: hypothetical protein VF317_00595 [Dermatophilaceae bacterium]